MKRYFVMCKDKNEYGGNDCFGICKNKDEALLEQENASELFGIDTEIKLIKVKKED